MNRIFQIFVLAIGMSICLGHCQTPSAMARAHPYRKLDKQLYNLNPRFRWDDQVFSYSEIPCEDWKFMQGKVLQITLDGLLLDRGDRDSFNTDLVFIRNFPDRNRIVDDSFIGLYAVPDGSYQYLSVLGVRKTIRAYDCGTIPSEKEIDQLKQAERVEREFAESQRKLQLEQIESARKSAKTRKAQAVQEANFKFRLERAQLGEGESQLRVAEFYLAGTGIERDEQAARRWLQAALTNGVSRASLEK
jgi:hypothetical protein